MQKIQSVLDKPAPFLEGQRMKSLLEGLKSQSTAAEAEREAVVQIEQMNHSQELEACLAQILALEGCLPFEARRRFRLLPASCMSLCPFDHQFWMHYL